MPPAASQVTMPADPCLVLTAIGRAAHQGPEKRQGTVKLAVVHNLPADIRRPLLPLLLNLGSRSRSQSQTQQRSLRSPAHFAALVPMKLAQQSRGEQRPDEVIKQVKLNSCLQRSRRTTARQAGVTHPSVSRMVSSKRSQTCTYAMCLSH